ncbi:zf-HC2 domain-containing protein [Paenibacillus mesophilus]|uniref:zf-HC2 domain-containing protein n=1 Tax=Paenibacillus mesophilus TaxID=2582849 RepID=UPI00110DC9CD|nr:zf-HC2 domain-containing protein [Paenibacillus mesophilus]TMV49520.1 zf-HC2 domain-containing protein [Paenibacillus mesophilus]
MSDIRCEVIKDLLPLYADRVCSEASSRVVEAHLAGCDGCREELDNIRGELRIPVKAEAGNDSSDGNAIKGISAAWNRSKTKAFIKGAVITALMCTVISLGYVGLFRWNVTTVSTDVIQITDVSKLVDGRVAYHVKLTDGYDLNEIRFETDENGNFYMTPYRPVIKAKPIANVGLFNMYYTFADFEKHVYQEKHGDDREITALYFGTRKDNILIWKKGMDLPAASDKVEAYFRGNE